MEIVYVGIVGSFFYFIFLIICFIRNFYVWKVLKDFKQLKFLFHISMTLSITFEFIYSLSLLSNNYNLWGYSFHVLGGYFYIIAYSSVLYLWGKTLGQNGLFAERACRVVIIINTICTCLVVGTLCMSDDMREFSNNYAAINILLIIVYSFTIVMLTSGMIWYGSRLLKQLKLTTLLHSNDRNNDDIKTENQKKIEIIIRINMVYMGCNICYIVRVAALIVLGVNLILGRTLQIGIFTWFLLSNWIPTIVPGGILLYIMRVKPPRRKEWRIDLSSAPIGLLTPINPSLTEQLTTQISNQDPAVYSTSTRSTSFKRNLPRQQSSSTNEDESLKSSENINISNDDHSSEDYIIHEDIRRSADSFTLMNSQFNGIA